MFVNNYLLRVRRKQTFYYDVFTYNSVVIRSLEEGFRDSGINSYNYLHI